MATTQSIRRQRGTSTVPKVIQPTAIDSLHTTFARSDGGPPADKVVPIVRPESNRGYFQCCLPEQKYPGVSRVQSAELVDTLKFRHGTGPALHPN